MSADRESLFSAQLFLCGGCNVNPPWEHRCHADGRRCDCEDCAGRACDCRDCRELRTEANKRCPVCGGAYPGSISHTRCM